MCRVRKVPSAVSPKRTLIKSQRHPKFICRYLGECCFVSLAVTVCADKHGYTTVGFGADRGRFKAEHYVDALSG